MDQIGPVHWISQEIQRYVNIDVFKKCPLKDVGSTLLDGKLIIFDTFFKEER